MNNGLILHGYFYTCEYYEWDEKNEEYKDPIKIRYKQNDEGTQGVSSTGKSQHMEQDIQGTPIIKKLFAIKVAHPLDYKPNDRIKLLNTNETYSVLKVFDDFRSTNSILNLTFANRLDNREYVLTLGQK